MCSQGNTGSRPVQSISRKGSADRLHNRAERLPCLKSLGGSNVVKVVPSSNGDASGLRVADKRLKVVCGANTSYLDDMAWVGDKTPLTLCDVRVSPSNTVKPNLGALELSEALSRVLLFTTKATVVEQPSTKKLAFGVNIIPGSVIFGH